VVSSQVIPTAETSLYGDNTTPARRGDGSFDEHLKTAEKKLLIAPWAEVLKVFDAVPLKFEFDFESSPIDNEVPREKPKPEPEKSSSLKPHPSSQDQAEDLPKIFSDLKVLKDMLIKNIPTSHLPIPLSSFAVSNDISSLQAVTRSDLQLLIDEIIEKIEFLKVGRRSELNLQLSYEELGNLQLSLISKNGLVSISITASPETKKALENNLSELELALKEAKINLDSIKIVEVTDDRRSQHTS